MRWTDAVIAAVGVFGIVAAIGAWLIWGASTDGPVRVSGEQPPAKAMMARPPQPSPAAPLPPATAPAVSLAQLRQWCVDSVRGGTPPAGYANACDLFAARSRQSLPPAAPKRLPPPLPSRAEPAPRPPVKSRPVPAVIVDECERERYGSIAFRQCRKREWQRLKKWCFNLNERANVAKGKELKEVMQWRTPVCLAYERYQIVK